MTARHKGKFCKIPDGYIKRSECPSMKTHYHHYDPSPFHYHWAWMLVTFALGVVAGLV
ncbi:MAG: hypothetical protein WCD70_15045 [Alphaproteobacteria bacterium]